MKLLCIYKCSYIGFTDHLWRKTMPSKSEFILLPEKHFYYQMIHVYKSLPLFNWLMLLPASRNLFDFYKTVTICYLLIKSSHLQTPHFIFKSTCFTQRLGYICFAAWYTHNRVMPLIISSLNDSSSNDISNTILIAEKGSVSRYFILI